VSGPGPRPPVLEFEAFGAAVGAAVVSGACALVEPFLAALTGALAALAVAGWVSLLRGRRVARGDLARPGTVLALGLLAVAAALYLLAAPELAATRGLLLGAGLVPLWLVERGRAPLGHRRRSGP